MVLVRWGRLVVAAVSGALVIVVTLGACSAGAVEVNKFKFDDAFGPDGPGSSFSSATSVAVDRGEGRVYVLDRVADAIYKFDLDGNPVAFGGSSPQVSGNKLSGLSLEDTSGQRQIGVDSTSHTIYVPGDDFLGWGGTSLQAFDAIGEPSKFTAGAGAGSNEIPGFQGLRAIVVDENGAIYAGSFGESSVGEGFKVFSATGAELVSESSAGSNGMGVDATGLLYTILNVTQIGRFAPSAYPVTASTTYSAVPGILNSNPARGIAIDQGSNRLFATESYTEGAKSISRVEIFDSEGVSEGTFGESGEGKLDNPAGVAVVERNEVTRAFVTNNPEGGSAQVSIFDEEVCACPPTIESISASRVTGDSATLRARINPGNLPTTYRFEYGPEDCEVTTCTQVPVGGAGIGDGRKGVLVTQVLAGLQAETTYHYRVVAENEVEEASSVDRTFTTQASGLGFGLSDSRVWEMVSPVQKHGGALFASGNVSVQASVVGNGLVYASLGSLVDQPNGSTLPGAATVLATRSNDGKWASEDLTPPHSDAVPIEASTEFKVFSQNLSRAEMEPLDGTPLSSAAIGRAPYLWTNGDPPLFTPLLTAANVPPGTDFGPKPGEGANAVRIEGATQDLEHVVIRSNNAPLVEGAAPGSIYSWHDGQLSPISELPGSDDAVLGMLGSGRGTVRHAISSDGARVFWTPSTSYTGGGNGLPSLYLRDMIAGESARLDVKESGASGTGEERPVFNGASADGDVVFFTDSQRLTVDASPSGRDLYRCELGPVGSGDGCTDLTDISASTVEPSESAEVLGLVSAMSEDGTRLYFTARGVLDEEPNEEGDSAQAGQPNLYLWEAGDGVQFIGTLAEADFPVWGGGFAVLISADVSPDGRYFAFTSEQRLTGYENRNGSEEANLEVFRFDAEAPEDRLSCVSCNPSGAAAVGELLPASEDVQSFPPDPGGLWGKRWAAATLPEASQTDNEGRSLYRPRSVLDNGRVFFNSVDPLVPADSNGAWDVYQWQPVGVGSCAAQTNSAAAVRSGNGCVSLISSGTADGDAGFLDATPSGDDVFFLTTGRLSVLDKDEQLDAYDARVDGIEAVLHPVQECAGEACQPSLGPPKVPTPASEAFRGAETPVNCRKGQRKVKRNGKTVCVKKHKKHKKHHQKKRAGKNGRASR
jgi:hypothetical protein